MSETAHVLVHRNRQPEATGDMDKKDLLHQLDELAGLEEHRSFELILPRRKVKVFDPIGAFDAFVAGFAAALCRRLWLPVCLLWAHAAGCIAVSDRAIRNPNKSQLMDFLLQEELQPDLLDETYLALPAETDGEVSGHDVRRRTLTHVFAGLELGAGLELDAECSAASLPAALALERHMAVRRIFSTSPICIRP